MTSKDKVLAIYPNAYCAAVSLTSSSRVWRCGPDMAGSAEDMLDLECGPLGRNWDAAASKLTPEPVEGERLGLKPSFVSAEYLKSCWDKGIVIAPINQQPPSAPKVEAANSFCAFPSCQCMEGELCKDMPSTSNADMEDRSAKPPSILPVESEDSPFVQGVALPWHEIEEDKSCSYVVDAQHMQVVEGEPAAIKFIMRAVLAHVAASPVESEEEAFGKWWNEYAISDEHVAGLLDAQADARAAWLASAQLRERAR